MAAMTSSMRSGFGEQNAVMQQLLMLQQQQQQQQRKQLDQSINACTPADSLVAMLASCSNIMGQQQQLQAPGSARSVIGGGSLEDIHHAVVGCSSTTTAGQKRQALFYPASFESSPGLQLQLDELAAGVHGVEYNYDDGDASLLGDDVETCGGASSPGSCNGGGAAEKKRRLTFEQVRSLERNFELENKLEPERKMQLATDLGLQPRQVAVWFQNRRARWKTKQLERDYEVLSLDYGRLKAEFEAVVQEKENLKSEVQRLSGITTNSQVLQQEELEPSRRSKSETTTTTATTIATTRQQQQQQQQQLDHQEQSMTSGADSNNSSEILNTDSPGTTTTTIHSHLKQQQQQFVYSSDHVCPADGQFDAAAAAAVAEIPVLIKLEADGHNSSSCCTYGQDGLDHSCNYFLSQLDDKATGAMPWWDWS